MNPKEGNINTPSPKITILGVGNELLCDEGVGIHVIKEIQERNLPPEIDIIEGGTDGFGLLNIITSCDHLIVIDSLKGGGSPGSIYRFHIDDAPNTPETIVIGVEPKNLKTGMHLSPEIKKKIPRIIELVLDEIDKISGKK